MRAEWSAIEALMRDNPACAELAPHTSPILHICSWPHWPVQRVEMQSCWSCSKTSDSGRPLVTSHLPPAIDDHYYHIQSSAFPSAALSTLSMWTVSCRRSYPRQSRLRRSATSPATDVGLLIYSSNSDILGRRATVL